MTDEVLEGEIVHVPQRNVQLGMIEVAPEEVVARGAEIATVLKAVIVEQKLFTNIGQGVHVHVEGWTTLGAMLGIFPMEEWAKDLDGKGYEVYVALIRVSDGIKIGGASALCMRSEDIWQDRPDYAVRSMAGTRATGKAYRLALSWIMKLAGYEVTPAEEMPSPKASSKSTQKSSNPPGGKTDPSTAFWTLANELSWTKDEAHTFIDAYEDMAEAYSELKRQHGAEG